MRRGWGGVFLDRSIPLRPPPVGGRPPPPNQSEEAHLPNINNHLDEDLLEDVSAARVHGVHGRVHKGEPAFPQQPAQDHAVCFRVCVWVRMRGGSGGRSSEQTWTDSIDQPRSIDQFLHTASLPLHPSTQQYKQTKHTHPPRLPHKQGLHRLAPRPRPRRSEAAATASIAAPNWLCRRHDPLAPFLLFLL